MAKIIIFEDDGATCDAITMILEGAHTVLTIEDFDNWQQDLLQFQPNVAIIDISLGFSDGIKIAEEIKGNAQMKHIGVIITSASSRLLPAGIEYDAFIEKPFDIKSLEENVLRLATKN